MGFVKKHRGEYSPTSTSAVEGADRVDDGERRVRPVQRAGGQRDAKRLGRQDRRDLMNVSTTMKNVYVSLSPTLDMSNVARIQRSSLYCSVEHRSSTR